MIFLLQICKINTTSLSCRHVIFENQSILYVSHDEDGYWQFLCGSNHTENEACVLALKEIYQRDRTIGRLADLPLGYQADRETIEIDWKITEQ